MADVRSLLRQERASRQQNSRPQKQSAAPAAAPISKKRKAADDTTDERKRTRTEIAKGVPAGFFDEGAREEEATIPQTGPEQETPELESFQPTLQQAAVPVVVPKPTAPQLSAADEADLDAFMKEIEETPQTQPVRHAYSANAVVEAAPMTAAEVAAQAREEQSAQRGRAEEELEAEREDAARQMEEEFEEMDGLEERVRKLREQREALRKARAQVQTQDIELPQAPPALEEEESESEDDEDWDDWRFRPA